MDWIARLDHLAVANDHCDVSVPYRKIARPKRVLVYRRAEALFLGEPRKIQSCLARAARNLNY